MARADGQDRFKLSLFMVVTTAVVISVNSVLKLPALDTCCTAVTTSGPLARQISRDVIARDGAMAACLSLPPYYKAVTVTVF